MLLVSSQRALRGGLWLLWAGRSEGSRGRGQGVRVARWPQPGLPRAFRCAGSCVTSLNSSVLLAAAFQPCRAPIKGIRKPRAAVCSCWPCY